MIKTLGVSVHVAWFLPVLYGHTGYSVSAEERAICLFRHACFVFLLAGVFFFSSIPEISDADTEARDHEALFEGNKTSFWKQYRLFHAAFAQFCCVRPR
jgi:hypothetical protein